jgi:pyruvate dehydrogenase E2 component (dihydrolipoamide acetyltransferase)
MATVVRMPSVLAGATEAAIASWLVSPGDTVTVGTPMAEIETEKALVEYAAEEAGVIGRLVLAVGDSGEIGDPIAVLVADGESDADIDTALGVAPAASGPRTFASPLVRKLAGEKGIDVAGLTGTGPGGRVVRRDLERFLAARPASGGTAERRPVLPPDFPRAAPAAPAAATSVGTRLIPHTPMRRAIARRLTESKATVPHFYLTAECVVDDLLALREQVNAALADGASPVRVSVNDFVIMAAAAAFGDVPEANVTWSDEGLIARDTVDISIAVATEGGLVTPVLRSVDGKRLSGIAREARDLAARARDKRLHVHELEGGAFSVSNLGMYGTLEFSAIINPPQSGILAVGAARPQPVVTDGALAIATVMRCTLSVDHRAIDGALAARWLAAFTTRLQHPLTTLI